MKKTHIKQYETPQMLIISDFGDDVVTGSPCTEAFECPSNCKTLLMDETDSDYLDPCTQVTYTTN